MIEFMSPKHSNVHFDSENHGTRLKGMTVNDLKQL